MVDLFGATVEPIVALFLLGEIGILVALVVAFFLGRTHKGTAHHYLMFSAFLADLLVFKPLMLSRASSAWGPYPWDGTRIAPHLFLSVVAALLGALVVVLGFRHRVKKGPSMFLPPKGRLHKVVGWVFLAVWLLAFVLGIVIFADAYFP